MNRYRSSFRAFFRWAFETGTAITNPAQRLRRAWVDFPPTRAITAGDVRRLLATIRLSDDPLRLRDEALFAIFALTGMRRSEALALGSTDYEVRAHTLSVRTGKGRKWRLVPVVAPLRRILDEFCGTRAGAGNLFPGCRDSRALTCRQAQARFEKWRRAAGLAEELTIHSFRVGFATLLHGGTGDVIGVSRLLGHCDLRPVLRYVDSSSATGEAMKKTLAVAFW